MNGDIISVSFLGVLLFSWGFVKIDYIWNLWLCVGSVIGIVVILDFVLDGLNLVVMVVLELVSFVLMGLGLVSLWILV